MFTGLTPFPTAINVSYYAENSREFLCRDGPKGSEFVERQYQEKHVTFTY
ncbi:hypothetical protein OH492_23790 [Vibrio chagasii]|nr:hypothetical protein [Vibrio chagasii]